MDEPWRPRGRATGGFPGGWGQRRRALCRDSKRERKFYAVQFHPEVVHTPHGAELLQNFTHNVAGCSESGRWRHSADRQ